jgi:hypothetical protein
MMFNPAAIGLSSTILYEALAFILITAEVFNDADKNYYSA